jgi:4-amino-4-deoxy-L-arabinose transferase-like glycosyltransferase
VLNVAARRGCATWAAIETLPVYVLSGLSMHFSHGWFEAYPPLHYYLLALAGSPVLLLHSLDLVELYSPGGAATLLLIYRVVSVLLALGTIVAVALTGLQAFGKRAALFAAAIAALVAPFVYYSKTANVDVPYVFWYSLSLLFYVRLLQHARLRDYLLFAMTATFAFCTKDQAYALYLTVPFVAVLELWREKAREGMSHPLLRAMVDHRLIAAALAAAITFVVVCNLLFNYAGFMTHARTITGAAAEYRTFEPTPDGRWRLFTTTLWLTRISMGWPLFVASAAGLVIGMATPRFRHLSTALAVALPAYYFGLINVVLYNYDRFMLPVCVVLALFGGLAIDWFIAREAKGGRWRQIAVASVFAYSIVYAASVDALMIADSRYTVERWMDAHIDRDAAVGALGPHENLPALDGFHIADFASTDELLRERPDYFVLNADYVRAAPPGSEWEHLVNGVQSGRLGYRLRYRFRRRTPLSFLPGAHPDLVGAREDTVVFTILRNINPTIEIFERPRRGPPAGARNGE